MRLDKALTEAGLTRSQARGAVRAGRAAICGKPETDAGAACEIHQVTLDGRPLRPMGEIYLMLNKPCGVVTAMADARLPAVGDLVPEAYRRRGLGPVGRLDRDVTGLVILTTDGQLAHRLISPRFKAEKVYRARVTGRLDEACVRAFSEGMDLGDFVSKGALLRVLEADDGASVGEVTLMEGKFHQIKRMFSKIGHPVERLVRLSIGGVALDGALLPGEIRPLTPEEIILLRQAAGMA